jgi:hypothetical protein
MKTKVGVSDMMTRSGMGMVLTRMSNEVKYINGTTFTEFM